MLFAAAPLGGSAGPVLRTFDRFDDVPADAWEHVARHATHPFLQGDYPRLIESTLADVATFRWLLVEDAAGGPLAVAGLSVMQTDLALLAPEKWRGFIGKYRKLRPSAGKINLLMCGLPVSNGYDCLALHPDADAALVARALDEATTALAREHRARMIVVKEFGTDDANRLAPLERFKFRKVDSLPQHVLPREHDSFDAYYASRSKRTRRNIRDYQKKGEAAGIAIETVPGREGVAALMTDEVHRLYLNVFDKAKLQFELLPRTFFAELANRFPDESRFTIARHEGRIVGFVAGLCTPPHHTLLKVGYDTSFDEDAALYFNLMYHALGHALEQPVDAISVGQGADEFKRRLGCVPHPRHFYLKVPGFITGTLARWLQPRMFPPRYDVATGE